MGINANQKCSSCTQFFHRSFKFIQFCTFVWATQIENGQVHVCYQAYLPSWRLWEKNEYLNFALLVHCTFKNIKVLARVWNAGCIDEENLCNNLAISSLVIVSFMPWYLCLIKQGLTSLSPLSPKSDQHQFSPNNINTQLREKVMRIDEIIT